MAIIPIGNDQKLKRFPWVTVGIILSNTVIMFWAFGHDPEKIFHEFGWVTGNPRIMTLITSQFLHSGLGHLVGNMIFLWAFGSALESAIGRTRFAAVYLAGGVFANMALAGQTRLFMPDHVDIPAVGASGAISAVMGMYIVRCWFSRIRFLLTLGLPFLFIPWRFKVNAIPLLLLHMSMDLYYGFKFLDAMVYVAFWAHIGGYLFGAGLSLLFGYRREAGLDRRRQRSEKLIESDLGLGQARQDVEALIAADPLEGKAWLELARMDSRYVRRPLGLQRYQRAVSAFWKRGESDRAIEAYREVLTRYSYAFPTRFQLDLCREMVRRGLYDSAARGLEVFIRNADQLPPNSRAELLERAYLMLGPLLANHLDAPEMAGKIFRDFLERFPGSAHRETAERRLIELEADR